MPKRVARQTWDEQKRRYYAKHAIHKVNKFKLWTPEEDVKVVAHAIPDVALSLELCRPLQSIQIRRSKLKRRAALRRGESR